MPADSTIEARRERDRRNAEAKRRRLGIAPVKGTEINCARCGVAFIRSGVMAKFCGGCKLEARREYARDRVDRLSRERGAEKIGRDVACKECGAGFQTRGPRHVYCDACGKKAVMRLLPHSIGKKKEYIKAWTDRVYKGERREDYLRMQREKRERRKQNQSFTIDERMSAGIRGSLKKGAKRGQKWEALAGYSLAELIAHLERQFTDGMTWDNMGDWHIDHIVPKSSFQYESPECEGFKRAWALTNLRPLWAVDNLQKNSRRTHLI